MPLYREAYKLKSWEETVEKAAEMTKETGSLYIPCDLGEYTSPRYDIIHSHKVGDPVSKGLNGDYYPEGTITSVSASQRLIKTSTGLKFYRYKQSSSWLSDGVWFLVRGHINERNPSF